MYTSHFIANGELQTAYHDMGSGPPIIFVHGFTGSKLDFVSQLAWFVEGHRVIAFDQRGHGETSNQGPYTLATMADDLINFMDAIEVATAHVLGHSMGGMVLLRAALAQPQRFASLMLMDTAPYSVDLWDEQSLLALHNLVADEGPVGLLPAQQGHRAGRIQQRGIDFLGEQEHWRRIKLKLTQMDPEAFIQLSRELQEQESVLARLPDLSIPTTVIVGAKDKPFRKPSKDMAGAIDDANLVVIPKAAHSPQYEHADVWRDAVLAHLQAAVD